MALTPGVRVGPYEILAPIGAGGMGEVYKARDLKLGRDVALKVLREEIASDSERLRRFEQEARAASSLNHPNIVTIHDIGEQQGIRYIAMEYVDGKTLRELLKRAPLPGDELIRYAMQLAEGLSKAHQAGIVHRDLKPANIIVSDDGYVKILDFGLAKLTPSHIVSEMKTMDRPMTDEGVIVGTVQYMSPEQAAGRSVDFRSDQFALGSIVYEMATGKRPFERGTAPETLTAIIRDEPEPVTVLNPRVPVSITHVIARCLSKEPKGRYSSTRDISRDLHREELAQPAQPSGRHPVAAVGAVGLLALILVMIYGLFVSDIREWVGGGSNALKIASIAVLPLENLSGDPEQEYFADGMTEALITDLAKIGSLKVISRTSIMQYKGARKSMREIGKELGVDAVIEGSALRVGDRVRITAQLIHAGTDEHLWAESYEHEVRDILALQSEVAQAIAGAIRIVLTPEEKKALLAAVRPVDPDAHDAYLRGRYYSSARTRERLTKGVEYYLRAIDFDPGYPEAYAGLSECQTNFSLYGYVPAGEAYPRAKAAAVKALELDESLAEAHAALGNVHFLFEWDWQGAEREFERALELNPNSATALMSYSPYLILTGRFDEGIAANLRALELDPLSPFTSVNLGWSYFMARRYDESIAQLERTLELAPNFHTAHMELGWNYLVKGMPAEAIAESERALAHAPRDARVVRAMAAWVYGVLGERGKALELLNDLKTFAAQRYAEPLNLAIAYAGLGERELAIEWLTRCYDERSPGAVFLKVIPHLDTLRDDPRVQELLRRMDFPN